VRPASRQRRDVAQKPARGDGHRVEITMSIYKHTNTLRNVFILGLVPEALELFSYFVCSLIEVLKLEY
jgi:hypothetical protein